MGRGCGSSVGSSPWKVFLAQRVGAVVDPVPLAAGAQRLAPISAGWAGMQYGVKLTDHLGAGHSLLHSSADLVTSTAVGNLHGHGLLVNDSTQRLTAADFTPSLQGGSMMYTLSNPTFYRLRVDQIDRPITTPPRRTTWR